MESQQILPTDHTLPAPIKINGFPEPLPSGSHEPLGSPSKPSSTLIEPLISGSHEPLPSGSDEQVIYGKPHRRFKAIFGRLLSLQPTPDISNPTVFQSQQEPEQVTIWIEEGKTDPLIQLLIKTGSLQIGGDSIEG